MGSFVTCILICSSALLAADLPERAQSNSLGLPPNAQPRTQALSIRLLRRAKLTQDGKKPRTKHVQTNGDPVFVNRLVLESSPYLRQHAFNPVDFMPWGDEAFAIAKALNRPVLLSVGYSTCHWCHVMEEESFDDVEIASYLNANYIVVKVDREERPDVDAVYMSAVQALTGQAVAP